MIILIHGQDTYRSREEIRKIIELYKKASKDWFDFIRIDISDKEIEIFEQIRQSINTVSMFDEKKLVIVENIFSANKELQEDTLEFFENRNLEKDKDRVVIFWDEKIDKKSILYKFLKSRAKVQEFEPLKGAQLKNWIRNYVVEQKGKIENSAAEKLIEYVGKDLWRMSNEINKLLNYNKNIKVEYIELLIKPEIDLNIFEMVDALGYKNKNKVLKIFNQFLEKREDEVYLLTMFIYQIRNLIKVKAGGRLDLHPFVIKKSRQQARNFSFEDLKKIYYQLLTIDLDIKTGKSDPKTALELFIVGL